MESTPLHPVGGNLCCPSCGEPQPEDHDGDPMCGWHQSGCEQVTKFELAHRIALICAEIDRRYGNPIGTAAQGMFAHYYPPGPTIDLDVLRVLHDDARDFLADDTPAVEPLAV